jgi:hypothetical protein
VRPECSGVVLFEEGMVEEAEYGLEEDDHEQHYSNDRMVIGELRIVSGC